MNFPFTPTPRKLPSTIIKPSSNPLIDPRGDRSLNTLAQHILRDAEAPVSDIISRSLITSSFNGKDRFDWDPDLGLRVSIPDRHSFIPFARASAADLRSRVFPFPPVRGNRHRSAPKPKTLPERSLAWWFAQLVHYGLPITNDKDQAQESIKIAISKDRLAVPSRLRELENKLKKKSIAQATAARGIKAGKQRAQEGQAAVLATSTNNSELTFRHGQSNNGDVSNDSIDRTATQTFRSPTSRQDGGDDSESDSNSESSDQAPPTSLPKNPNFTYTPNGSKVIRPAEYPASRERDEKFIRDNQKLKSSVATLFDNDDHQSENQNLSEATPLVSHEGRNNFEPTETTNLRSHRKNLRTLERPKPVAIPGDSLAAPNGLWELESSGDEASEDTGSLVFFTPLQSLTKRRAVEKDSDEASVIISGSKIRSKVNHKQELQAKKGKASANKDIKTRKRSDRADNKSEHSTPVTVPTTSIKQEVTQKSKQTSLQSSNLEKPKVPSVSVIKHPQQIIEISSASSQSSSVDDSGDDSEVQKDVIKHQRQRSKSVLINNIRDVAHSAISAQPTPARMVKSSTVTRSAAGPYRTSPKHAGSMQDAIRHSTPSKAIPSSLGQPKTAFRPHIPNAGTKPFSQQHTNTSGVVARELGKKGKKRCQSITHGEICFVQDCTGCGITEMSGALFSEDESAGNASEISTLPMLTLNAAGTAVPRSAAQSQHTPGRATSAVSDDLIPNVPSIGKLFTSQQTPTAWKHVNKTPTNQNKKNRAGNIQNQDAVASRQAALATLPKYLKTSYRHGSPELTQNSTTPSTTHGAEFGIDPAEQHPPSRSSSLASTTSRKRRRQSMLDIELGPNKLAESTFIPAPKRQRTSSSQLGQSSSKKQTTSQAHVPMAGKSRDASSHAVAKTNSILSSKSEPIKKTPAGVSPTNGRGAAGKNHNRGRARHRAKSVGVKE